MSESHYEIESEIESAATLPGWYYKDTAAFERSKEEVFACSWQLAGHTDLVRVPGQVQPFTLLEGFLDEPLMLSRDLSDTLHCLSNVCTHRGNILCEHGGVEKSLRCRYHGRRFALDGKFQTMPECDGMKNFPSEGDNLPKVAFEVLENLIFVSLRPSVSFEDLIGPMKERIGWMPLKDFRFDATRSRDYLVHAHWALYCDNYLEGFHIPYVHSGLNEVLDYGSYRTELFKYANLQLGVARKGESSFTLPKSSKDHGTDIAAYYFWLFPNMMFNFYPWGLSVNIVKPLAIDRTKISYLTYVWDESKIEQGAGSILDRVEREDEAIVENVHKGVRSRLYSRGRFSPKHERGVHQFHRLLAATVS